MYWLILTFQSPIRAFWTYLLLKYRFGELVCIVSISGCLQKIPNLVAIVLTLGCFRRTCSAQISAKPLIPSIPWGSSSAWNHICRLTVFGFVGTPMMRCLTVKEVWLCYVTAEINNVTRRRRQYQFCCVDKALWNLHWLFFLVDLFLWDIITFVSHISPGGSGIESVVNMTNYVLCFVFVSFLEKNM